MDWRYAYQGHVRDVTAQLRQARRDRVPSIKLASRTVEPIRLSDDQITSAAILDAEVVIQFAINQHNEEIARKARE